MAANPYLSLEPRSITRPRVRPERNLRLVEPPRYAGRYLLAALLLAAVGVFGVVSLHALATESAFEARELEREVASLELRYDELNADVAALESPQHVAQVAAELGLVPATEPAYLRADGGALVADSGAADLALATDAQGERAREGERG